MTAPTINSLKVTPGIAGQVAVDVDLTYHPPMAADQPMTAGLVGSTYGGRVFLVLRGNQHPVIDPERFGTFGDDPEAWARKFFA